MKVYVNAGSFKNIMNRLLSSFGKEFKSVFKTEPRSEKVKDPDTDQIGTLYEYRCADPDMSLNVELYQFPGSNRSFIVRCYIRDKSGPISSTIDVLNSSSSDGYKPIKLSSLSSKIKQYADKYYDLLGSFEDADVVDTDVDNMGSDDGFEAE